MGEDLELSKKQVFDRVLPWRREDEVDSGESVGEDVIEDGNEEGFWAKLGRWKPRRRQLLKAGGASVGAVVANEIANKAKPVLAAGEVIARVESNQGEEVDKFGNWSWDLDNCELDESVIRGAEVAWPYSPEVYDGEMGLIEEIDVEGLKLLLLVPRDSEGGLVYETGELLTETIVEVARETASACRRAGWPIPQEMGIISGNDRVQGVPIVLAPRLEEDNGGMETTYDAIGDSRAVDVCVVGQGEGEVVGSSGIGNNAKMIQLEIGGDLASMDKAQLAGFFRVVVGHEQLHVHQASVVNKYDVDQHEATLPLDREGIATWWGLQLGWRRGGKQELPDEYYSAVLDMADEVMWDVKMGSSLEDSVLPGVEGQTERKSMFWWQGLWSGLEKQLGGSEDERLVKMAKVHRLVSERIKQMVEEGVFEGYDVTEWERLGLEVYDQVLEDEVGGGLTYKQVQIEAMEQMLEVGAELGDLDTIEPRMIGAEEGVVEINRRGFYQLQGEFSVKVVADSGNGLSVVLASDGSLSRMEFGVLGADGRLEIDLAEIQVNPGDKLYLIYG